MQFMPTLLPIAILLLAATSGNATESITISRVDRVPLLDGRCAADEWHAATLIELQAKASVYLMHDTESLYVCAKGKPEDYTVIDLYIERAKTGSLHNLHASAQLGERTLTGNQWADFEWWQITDWGGFWVPYAGEEETEDGTRTRFLKGSGRELRILRRKFEGDAWTMMIRLAAIAHPDDPQAKFVIPQKAVETNKATWARFEFEQ